MTGPGMGRRIQIPAHTGQTGQVAHEDEQGNDAQFQSGSDFKGLATQGGQGGRQVVDGCDADHADDDHGQGDGHAQG